MTQPILSTINRELKKLSEGIKIDAAEVEQIIRTEVLKREVVEGDEAEAAQARVRKFSKKGTPRRRQKAQTTDMPSPPLKEESVTEKLLREAEEQETNQQTD